MAERSNNVTQTTDENGEITKAVTKMFIAIFVQERLELPVDCLNFCRRRNRHEEDNPNGNMQKNNNNHHNLNNKKLIKLTMQLILIRTIKTKTKRNSIGMV